MFLQMFVVLQINWHFLNEKNDVFQNLVLFRFVCLYSLRQILTFLFSNVCGINNIILVFQFELNVKELSQHNKSFRNESS